MYIVGEIKVDGSVLCYGDYNTLVCAKIGLRKALRLGYGLLGIYEVLDGKFNFRKTDNLRYVSY